MNEQCKFTNANGYRCGSYAFNLYKEQIDQGDRCDHHYWQEQAMKAAEQEREECAKVCETSDRYRGDYFAAVIRKRGTT